ncbi:MAG: ROK family transcriptional regulator, partial [Jiangellaceae bacterium]
VADGAAAAVRAALAGGSASHGFLLELADRLAVGLAAVCAVVDPAVVVLAGEIGAAGDDALCELVSGAIRRIAPVNPRVVPTQILETPVLRGAVLTAVEQARQAVFSSTV